MRKMYILLIIFILVVLPTGCSLGKQPLVESFIENDINYISKVNKDSFQVYRNQEWNDLIIKGVNLQLESPIGIPSEKDYHRWFEQIGEMNANTIRINSIFPPEFYTALEKYNSDKEAPLYFFQGIPIDEEPLIELLDPYKLDNIVPFKSEISRAIDIVHGNSENYKSNVSQYLLGWVLGIEWPIDMVDNTNRNRLDKDSYDGNYVYTEEARPFETWLADVMDHTLSYEIEKYQWEHPISFINTPKTDILKHAYEPKEEYSLVSIDPNTIKLKNNKSGQFASYHVYPFYPEFMNLEPKYTRYIDHRGKANNFAGYLNDLIGSHEIPILVTEFGFPSSRAMSKTNIHGWNEGNLTENEQGQLISNLFEDIIVEGGLGGIVSNWQDQWTIWPNVQDSKEHYGLLSFNKNSIKINENEPIYSTDKKDENYFKDLYINHDEGFLYLGIKYKDLKNTPLDTIVFLDTIPEEGNRSNPFNNNINTETGTDFVISIPDKGIAKILSAAMDEEENEIYKPIEIQLNEKMTIPNTSLTIPSLSYETGILKEENGDFYRDRDNNLLEIRIPWALIGFKDPSSKKVLGPSADDDEENTINIPGIKVSLASYRPEDPSSFHSLPLAPLANIPSKNIFTYSWDDWTEPVIEERLKESYYIIQEVFSLYN